MNLLIMLLIIVIISLLVFKGSADTVEGARELMVNREESKGKVYEHSYSNFSSFIASMAKKIKKSSFPRLICVIGADLSGRSHLAKMIEKKYDYKYIDERENGKKIDMPRIREKFFVDINNLRGKDRERAQNNAKKYVISGNFSPDDLHRLFKGDPLNRNFVLLFVKPRKEVSRVWKSATKKSDDDYAKMISEGNRLLDAVAKEFKVNVVKNKFN